MNRFFRAAIGATALAAGIAAAPATADVTVKGAWVRGIVPAQTSTGAFMQITASTPTRLVAASSPVAKIAEIHEMAVTDNVMRMRAVPGIDFAAGQSVELKPGGYHVMLMDLKAPLKDGDAVPVTLVFEGPDKKREAVEVQATVRPLAAGNAPMKMH